MITTLSGTVAHIFDHEITLELNGLGFGVQVANATGYHQGMQARFFIYMHWNQEQGPSLFGFATQLEKDVFVTIISCSGIGPKIGLSIVQQLGINDFLNAVQTGNEKALSSVSGIGPKKAEQMMVQLKHKVAKLIDRGITITGSPELEQRSDIAQVLKSLNYSKPEITAAMHHIQERYAGAQVAFDQLVRHALSFLSKKP